MSKTIYKYPLEVTDTQQIPIPDTAEILSCQIQDGKPCLWVLLDISHAITDTRTIKIYGTGNPYDTSLSQRFIDTFQLYSGSLIFHVFEVLIT